MSFKNDQVSERETEIISEYAKASLVNEGDFVEMGCYKGDTSLLLAEILQHYFLGHTRGRSPELMVQKNDVCNTSAIKHLWIYDSFEGLPEKGEEDFSEAGKDFKKGELFVTKREVKERFLRAGLPVPVIKKAWFNDLSSEDMPEKISFAFLDGDLYESIRDSLKLVEGRMSERGVILVHDYNNPALPGVAKAVDEWLENKKYTMTWKESLAVITI